MKATLSHKFVISSDILMLMGDFFLEETKVNTISLGAFVRFFPPHEQMEFSHYVHVGHIDFEPKIIKRMRFF